MPERWGNKMWSPPKDFEHSELMQHVDQERFNKVPHPTGYSRRGHDTFLARVMR